MLFNSLAFVAFFVVVFSVYWLLPWHRARIWWLLAASIQFYRSWSQELALLVTATSILDFVLARAMEKTPSPLRRKVYLGLSLGVNLGLLAYFKYANFFLDSLRAGLQSMGWTGSLGALEIIAPFGISFYTFEAISYTIDVYRGRMKAETSLPRFMLFILFFPHLVAGPIVRAWDFLPQAARNKRWSWFRMGLGAQLICTGLFKKIAIADRLAIYSDAIFTDPDAYSGKSLWIGLFAFGLRIYFDFSGYTDMALGIAHCFGYKLTKNFNLPYLSGNVSEFWRRWHISLSTWLRDYLFIPMGGSRGKEWQIHRNLLVTMTLGGLWHGAQWSYVLWGVLHGLYLVIHRIFRKWTNDRPGWQAFRESAVGNFACVLTTFLVVMLTWSLFQPSLTTTGKLWSRLLTMPEGKILPLNTEWFLLCLIGMFAVEMLNTRGLTQKVWRAVPAPLAGMTCGLIFLSAVILSPQESRAFIYFQF